MQTTSPLQYNDVSVTLVAGAGSLAGNIYREVLIIQPPSGSAVTFSFTNASPAANATGCFTLLANSAPVILFPAPKNTVYLAGTGTAVIPIAEGVP